VRPAGSLLAELESAVGDLKVGVALPDLTVILRAERARDLK
jgi:hypothetical protein